MFGKNKRKQKKLDALAMPIEDRIQHLETTAALNAESKVAIFGAIDAELSKISEHAEGLPHCKRKKKK